MAQAARPDSGVGGYLHRRFMQDSWAEATLGKTSAAQASCGPVKNGSGMMGRVNRASVLVGTIAALMLSLVAVTVRSRVTSAGNASQTATADCSANQADDAAETKDAPDTDRVDQQCGPQDAADGGDAADAHEPKDAADTDNVEQQDGPQDAPDAGGAPETP